MPIKNVYSYLARSSGLDINKANVGGLTLTCVIYLILFCLPLYRGGGLFSIVVDNHLFNFPVVILYLNFFLNK